MINNWMWRSVNSEMDLLSRRGMALLIFLVLPSAKDGPINIDLIEAKFLLVLVLFLAALPEIGHAIRSKYYQQILVLSIFSVFLTITAYSLSDVRELSSNMSLVVITNVLFMFALCRLFNFDLLRLGVIATAVVSLVVCVVAIAQYLVIQYHLSHPMLVGLLPPEQQMGYFDLDLPVGAEGIRVSSVFYHSNQLGHFLAVSFALFFPLLLQEKKAHYQILYGLLIVIVITCTFLSQSRGGVLLVVLAAAMTLFLYGSEALKRWKNKLVIMIGFVVLGVSIFTINASAFLSRIISPGLSSRELNWLYALRLIPDNAMFGVGRGVSGYHITINYPAIEYVSLLNNHDVKQIVNLWANNPHNYYLATILESGIFTLAAEIMLFGLMIICGFKVLSRTENAFIKALAIGATTILIMEYVRGTYEAYVFWSASETGGILAFICAMLLYFDSRMDRRVIVQNHKRTDS